jgi:transposase
MSKTNVLRQKQYTTEVANKSRLITKVRWVVERANGRINQWRFLDKVVPNRLVKYIGDFVKIVCAILN